MCSRYPKATRPKTFAPSAGLRAAARAAVATAGSSVTTMPPPKVLISFRVSKLKNAASPNEPVRLPLIWLPISFRRTQPSDVLRNITSWGIGPPPVISSARSLSRSGSPLGLELTTSMTSRPCRLANWDIVSMSQGTPKRCVATIARVLEVICLSTESGSILKDRGEMSASLGTSPFAAISRGRASSDLVARLEPKSLQDDLQPVPARTSGHGKTLPNIAGEALLEQIPVFPVRDLSGA